MTRKIWIIFVLLFSPACSLPFLSSNSPPDFSALETAAQATVAARSTQDALFRDAATALVQTMIATNANSLPSATSINIPVNQTAAAGVTAQPEAVLTANALAQAATASIVSAAQTLQATQQPARPQIPVVGRFTFTPGGTSGITGGDLPGRAVIDYLVNAAASQLMMASVYSPNNDVALGVTGMDGTVLQRVAAGQTTYSGVLPASQDYRLTLAAPPLGSSFTVQVILPARIQFSPGAAAATLNGQLPANETNYYLANARGGQTMRVRIVSGSGAIFLTIYGLTDGSPLVRSVMAQSEWSGVLPIDQDYMIQAVNTGAAGQYTLEITIQ